MNRGWIVVASAEHARRGQAGGFMQACHGKAAPLRRIAADDPVICYSPTETFGGKDKLQAFTAIGRASDEAPFQFDMGGGFHPFRRAVKWLRAKPVPIRPLLDRLDFTSDGSNWGAKFRFGLFEIGAADVARIAEAMEASL